MSKPKPISDDVAQKIRAKLSYDAATGTLAWISKRVGGARRFDQPGHTKRCGYRYITIGQRPLLEHRICWFLHYGQWPELTIDHVNGNKLDNRIANLRLATDGQNISNRPSRQNSVGVKGVDLTPSGKFRAQISHLGQKFYLGAFDTAREAGLAYAAAATTLHGEFANLAIEQAVLHDQFDNEGEA